MILALQIGVGIWIGGLLLIGTVSAYIILTERIEKNRRMGFQWWHGILKV